MITDTILPQLYISQTEVPISSIIYQDIIQYFNIKNADSKKITRDFIKNLGPNTVFNLLEEFKHDRVEQRYHTFWFFVKRLKKEYAIMKQYQQRSIDINKIKFIRINHEIRDNLCITNLQYTILELIYRTTYGVCKIPIKQISIMLNISHMTLYRNIDTLLHKKLIQRCHNGYMLNQVFINANRISKSTSTMIWIDIVDDYNLTIDQYCVLYTIFCFGNMDQKMCLLSKQSISRITNISLRSIFNHLQYLQDNHLIIRRGMILNVVTEINSLLEIKYKHQHPLL